MKSDKKILLAFLLNAIFSLIEFIGGAWTGSIAILSDAVHDLGDAISIGVAYLFERKSKKPATEKYTYGYVRYSVLGGLFTSLVLFLGSILVLYNAGMRLANPVPVNYTGMVVLAILGVIVNFIAAFITHDGHSINQKAVSLHMFEDVLGWVAVLIGAIVMHFTQWVWIDAALSIGVAIFVLINSVKLMASSVSILLEKSPHDINVACVQEHVMEIIGVEDVHHMHVWSIDGLHHCATMHVVCNSDTKNVKDAIKHELAEHGIVHTTIEFETSDEECQDKECQIERTVPKHHHHHHH